MTTTTKKTPGLTTQAISHIGAAVKRAGRVGFIDDTTAYGHVWLDTPLWPPKDRVFGGPAGNTAFTPGCCVKTIACGRDGFPERFGKLAHYNPDGPDDGLAVVLCTATIPSDTRRTIWVGSVTEYAAVWEVD